MEFNTTTTTLCHVVLSKETARRRRRRRRTQMNAQDHRHQPPGDTSTHLIAHRRQKLNGALVPRGRLRRRRRLAEVTGTGPPRCDQGSGTWQRLRCSKPSTAHPPKHTNDHKCRGGVKCNRNVGPAPVVSNTPLLGRLLVVPGTRPGRHRGGGEAVVHANGGILSPGPLPRGRAAHMLALPDVRQEQESIWPCQTPAASNAVCPHHLGSRAHTQAGAPNRWSFDSPGRARGN